MGGKLTNLDFKEAISARVLVLDDDELVLMATAGLLARLGLKSVLCLDRQEGVRRFSLEPHGYAAVIMDVVMPGMDAREALEEIRNAHPNPTVILASGYDDQELRRQLGEDSQCGFLRKPYTLEVLQAALEVLSPGLLRAASLKA